MRRRSIVLDANLALLFIVGIYDPAAIAKHKRLASFDAVDFQILSDLIAESAGVVFCPHVLAETSNLLRLIGEPLKTALTLRFGEIIQKASEEHVASADGVANLYYARLGLTDAILLELTQSGRILLTIDLDLYLAANAAGKTVENFRHIQAQRPDFGWR